MLRKLRKPQFTLRTAMVAVACCAVLLWIAPYVRETIRDLLHSPSVYDTGDFDSELHAWPERAKAAGAPGIDEGSAYRSRTGYVIWTDFRWSHDSRGGKNYGSLVKQRTDGAQDVVRWRYTENEGTAGTLEIDDSSFALDEGAVILVSTQHDEIRVKQVRRDMSELLSLPSDRFVETLRAHAKRDKEIRVFFLDAAKHK